MERLAGSGWRGARRNSRSLVLMYSTPGMAGSAVTLFNEYLRVRCPKKSQESDIEAGVAARCARPVQHARCGVSCWRGKEDGGGEGEGGWGGQHGPLVGESGDVFGPVGGLALKVLVVGEGASIGACSGPVRMARACRQQPGKEQTQKP